MNDLQLALMFLTYSLLAVGQDFCTREELRCYYSLIVIVRISRKHFLFSIVKQEGRKASSEQSFRDTLQKG
jgi:hypothetical protein